VAQTKSFEEDERIFSRGAGSDPVGKATVAFVSVASSG